ncbi:hypothetical protein HELRODRAFT_164972 [Helobdella robusta]|uniref:Uncharacterized protein n=1 Tax=Helobdella robusta TaxID=6412 RepID=T1EW16_HELRO|nr:hypothetical protein HELRODRAFT_164972 [Helobdella robusta]ESN92841.1 hypothetical protein HELRODRAFT_164972 [Helobdella robusta]
MALAGVKRFASVYNNAVKFFGLFPTRNLVDYYPVHDDIYGLDEDKKQANKVEEIILMYEAQAYFKILKMVLTSWLFKPPTHVSFFLANCVNWLEIACLHSFYNNLVLVCSTQNKTFKMEQFPILSIVTAYIATRM